MVERFRVRDGLEQKKGFFPDCRYSCDSVSRSPFPLWAVCAYSVPFSSYDSIGIGPVCAFPSSALLFS